MRGVRCMAPGKGSRYWWTSRSVGPRRGAEAAHLTAQANPQLAVRLDDLVQRDLLIPLGLSTLLSREEVLHPALYLLKACQAGARLRRFQADKRSKWVVTGQLDSLVLACSFNAPEASS